MILGNDIAIENITTRFGYKVTNITSLDLLRRTTARVELPPNSDIELAINNIQKLDPDALIDLNHIYQVASIESAYGDAGYPIEIINKSLRLDVKQKIALIDTGVDRFHPSLRKADVVLKNFLPAGAKPSYEHGTAIASMLVGNDKGKYVGLLPNATLFSAAVFGVSSKGVIRSTAEDLVNAVSWLTRNQIPVINMSFAGPHNKLLQILLSTASDAGFIFVAAVGNEGPNAPPLYPAAYDDVIGVTAVDSKFRIYRRANTGVHVEFSAPGVKIRAAQQSNYSYKVFSGSSFAAPYVVALISLEIDVVSSNQKRKLLQRFRNNTFDLGSDGYDSIYGYGLIQPAN